MKSDRATIFVMDADDHPSIEYIWVVEWLRKWGRQVVVKGYSTGGSEHIWDVEGLEQALLEVPENFLCHSAWVERTASGWTANKSQLELKFKIPRKKGA